MTSRTLGLGAALLCLCAGQAHAQDALGSGRALDANLRAGSRGANTPITDFYTDLALRNAIVTGNAPGGTHFRAEVGYRAAGDFLGATPDDLLFNFQRDAYFSGVAASNVRGLSGLQLQMNVSVLGQSDGVGLIIQRPTSGVSAGVLDPNIADRRTDPYDTLQGSLRSTSGYLIRQADRPSIVGQRDYGDGTVVPLVASSLIGVRPLQFDNVALSGPNDAERARLGVDGVGLAIDPLTQLRGPQDPALDQAREADGVLGQSPIQMIDPNMRSFTQHEQLLQSLRRATDQIDLHIPPRTPGQSGDIATPDRGPDPIQPDPDDDGRGPTTPGADGATPRDDGSARSFDDLDAALRRLTESLAFDPMSGQPMDAAGESAGGDDSAAVFDSLDPKGRRPSPQDDTEGEGDAAKFDSNLTLLIEAMGQEQFVLRHFAPEEQPTGDALFVTHMRAGEMALRDGRWMDAEERFSVAISLRKGNSMAALGRVQAQIGAGLLRSAASNLRELMRAYPELARARLDPSLMPPRPRLDRISSQLERQRSRRSAGWIDAAFLSAYISYLLNDRITLVQAFEDLERALDATETKPDPVYGFLERIWLAETYNAEQPKSQPADPASGETDKPTR